MRAKGERDQQRINVYDKSTREKEKAMNRMIAIAAALVFAGWAGAENVASVQSTILANEHALGIAMISGDTPTLARLVADDWAQQDASGTLGTKAGFIHAIETGKLVVKEFTLHDLQVRVFGDVAVVQGFDDEQTTYDGKSSSGTYNWTDVWVKRDGKWASVATQITRVAQK
jgi:ketosteroid isomerase-like protein